MAVHADRRHEALPHTADAGFRTTAPTLGGALEEGAAALAELGWESPAAGSRRVPIEVAADDLVGLAYRWLNELLTVASTERGALTGAAVEAVAESDGRWRLTGEARLAALDEPGVGALRDIKSVTFHRLAVEEGEAGWLLTAYVDL